MRSITILFSLLMWSSRQAHGWIGCCPRLHQRYSTALQASSSSSSSSSSPEPNYTSEETLLRLSLAIAGGADPEQARKDLSKYCQSFPFAVVLPVQPLMYLPTDDGGVEVRFLRKKTTEKSGVDGGIRFFMVNDDNDSWELTAKRNSLGQTVPKMFAERLVVTSFVAGITGKDNRFGQPPSSVKVTSVFHPWMDALSEGNK